MNTKKAFVGLSLAGLMATMFNIITYKRKAEEPKEIESKEIEVKDDKYYTDIRKKELITFIEYEKKYRTEKERTLESLNLYEDNDYIRKKRQETLHSIDYYNRYIKQYETEKEELDNKYILKEELVPLMPVDMGYRNLKIMSERIDDF